MSTFGGLEIAKRALIAQQAVLQTVGHNLANGATPGYTRQRVELSAVNPQNGVEVIGHHSHPRPVSRFLR